MALKGASTTVNPNMGYHVTMTKRELTRFQQAMADLLCWHNGFRAARGDDAPAVLGLDEIWELKSILEEKLEDIDKMLPNTIGPRAGYAE